MYLSIVMSCTDDDHISLNSLLPMPTGRHICNCIEVLAVLMAVPLECIYITYSVTVPAGSGDAMFKKVFLEPDGMNESLASTSLP